MTQPQKDYSVRSPLREEQLWLLTGGVLLLAFVAFSFAMYFTRSFMIPFVFSIFLCAMVSPINNLIVVKWKAPRWVGLISSLLFIMLLFVLFFIMGRFAVNSISKAIQDVTLASETSTAEALEEMLDRGMAQIGVDQYVSAKHIVSTIRQEIPTLLEQGLKTCQNLISSGMLVFLFCLFILMGHDPRVRAKNEIYSEMERSIQKYLNIKCFISLATGIVVYLIFCFLGVPLAFLYGLIAFVLNFIPSIGSIIATILPIPIILLTTEVSHTTLILAMVLPTLTQQFFGNLLEPKLQGQGLNLHPVTILLALGLWGVVWGPAGMLLAAPITAALRIILLEFEMTAWMAHLMAGVLPAKKRTIVSEIDFSDDLDEPYSMELPVPPGTSMISTTVSNGSAVVQTTLPAETKWEGRAPSKPKKSRNRKKR